MVRYILRISSKKGGVGKSVIATNLAVAIKRYGYEVLLVDADFSNPSVGTYLGLESISVGVEHVIMNKVKIRQALVTHPASGIKVLPTTIDADESKVNETDLMPMKGELESLKYDFIIVDTRPGLQSLEVLKLYNEVLVVTTPNEVACMSAIKMLMKCREEKVKASLLVNRVRNRNYELSKDEIEEMCEQKICEALPEDETVQISVANRIPVYIQNKNTPFSKEIDKLAQIMVSRVGSVRTP